MSVGDSIRDQVRVLEMTEKSLPFVIDSWLKSYRDSEAVQGLSREVYFDGQRGVIERLLKRATVRLVVNRDDPDQFYGWSCFESTVPIATLHYVYVKHKFRGFGLDDLLVSDLIDAPVVYSHLGSFKDKLPAGSYFNPYKAMA